MISFRIFIIVQYPEIIAADKEFNDLYSGRVPDLPGNVERSEIIKGIPESPEA